MKKYFNLVLNIPIIAIAVRMLLGNMNIVSAVLALVCISLTLKATVTDKKSAIQLIPVYLAGWLMSVISIWLPIVIANRNAQPLDFEAVLAGIAQNPNTELIPIIVAVGMCVLLKVLSGVISNKAVSEAIPAICFNVVAIAVIKLIFPDTYLEKFLIFTLVIILLYVLLFQEEHRLTNASLCGLLVIISVTGVLLYYIASDYVQFYLASKIPTLLTPESSKMGFIYSLLALFYMLTAHFISQRKQPKDADNVRLAISASTIPVLFMVYSFASKLAAPRYFLYAAASCIVVLNILLRVYALNHRRNMGKYIYTIIASGVLAILLAMLLGRADLVLSLFGGDIVLYCILALLLASVVLLYIRVSIAFLCLSAAVLVTTLAYSFNIFTLTLVAAIVIVGFLQLIRTDTQHFYSAAALLVLAFIPTYFMSPSAEVYIYNTPEGPLGSKSLNNSLLCVLQKEGEFNKGSTRVSWADGEVLDSQGFTKIFTRVRASDMTVETKSTIGISRKQHFSFTTDGDWRPYTAIENGHDALKIVEYDKQALPQNALPIRRGTVVEDGNVYVTDKSVCISMQSKKAAKALEYIIVDKDGKCLSDGYVANSAYIEITFPQVIPEGSRLLALVMDESYNVIPVTTWNIIG